MQITSFHQAIAKRTGLSTADVQRFYSSSWLSHLEMHARERNEAVDMVVERAFTGMNNSTFFGGKRAFYESGKPFVSTAALFQVDLPQALVEILKAFRNEPKLTVSDIACGVGASTVSVAATIESARSGYKDKRQAMLAVGLQRNDLDKSFSVTGYDPNPNALKRAEQRQYSLDEINNGYHEDKEMRAFDQKAIADGIRDIAQAVVEDSIRQNLPKKGVSESYLKGIMANDPQIQQLKAQLLPSFLLQVNNQVNGIHERLVRGDLLPQMVLSKDEQYALGDNLSSIVHFRKMNPFDFSDIPESHLISSFRFLSNGGFLSDAGVAEILNGIASRLPDKGIFFTDWFSMGGLTHQDTHSLKALVDNNLIPDSNLPGILQKEPKVQNFDMKANV